MRLPLIAALLLGLTLNISFAQSPPTGPTIAISPPTAGQGVTRDVQLRGFTPGVTVTTVIFDPAGMQTVELLNTDSSGSAEMQLKPPNGSWTLGLYRVVAGTGGVGSVSGEFVASDGQPHLSEAEDSPSPFTAFNVQGSGLPPNSPEDITLYLAGQLGQRTFRVTTDDNGTLSLYVWPQQFGFAFFAAGTYRAVAPSLNLETDFIVREHPVSAFITVNGPVTPGAGTRIDFFSYVPGRYLWVVYGTSAGSPSGEALVGPTDVRGKAVATLPFDGLTPGDYLMATPFDWGEAAFNVVGPGATTTPIVTPAKPTPTAAPTLTPAPAACFIVVRLAHRTLKAGSSQTATVTTLPAAAVRITAHFPNRKHQSKSGLAGNDGNFSWTYTQPRGVTSAKETAATVTATATCSGQLPVRASKSYHIREAVP
jgi:hypothetical protein